jgi:hypothetical protein
MSGSVSSDARPLAHVDKPAGNGGGGSLAGDTRCVRPLCPCRPSKLRFDVLPEEGEVWDRVDFRHPAFRLVSPQGTRRDRTAQMLMGISDYDVVIRIATALE